MKLTTLWNKLLDGLLLLTSGETKLIEETIKQQTPREIPPIFKRNI